MAAWYVARDSKGEEAVDMPIHSNVWAFARDVELILAPELEKTYRYNFGETGPANGVHDDGCTINTHT